MDARSNSHVTASSAVRSMLRCRTVNPAIRCCLSFVIWQRSHVEPGFERTVMSTIVLFPLFALTATSAFSEVLPPFERTRQEFQAYMADLDLLAQRWQRSAEMIANGDAVHARKLLAAPTPESLDPVWADRQAALLKQARTPYEKEWLRQQNCYALGRWYLDAGQPTLAAVRLQDCPLPWRAYERHKFGVHHARALFESGRFADAADRLTAMDTSGWPAGRLKEQADWIATLRRYGDDDPLATGPPCEQYLLGTASSLRSGEPATILGVFQCMQESDAGEMRTHLLGQFARARDDTAKRILLLLSATDPTARPEDIAAALLTLGADAHSAEDFSEALRLWRHVADQYPQTPSGPKAMYNIAKTLKSQHRYDDAIDAFIRLRDANVNDQEPGAHLMEPYRNYRPKASWEIGLCRLVTGDPEGALRDFLNTRDNFPFQSWCGNAHWEFAYKYAAHEGICLEMLGHYDRAIGAYFRGPTDQPGGGIYVTRRIVNLYESAGQTDQLLELCDEVDAFRLSEIRRVNPELPTEFEGEWRPTAWVRAVLDIRGMNPIEHAAELIEIIDERNGSGPDTLGSLRSNWQAVEAAGTMARKPNQSFRLLRQQTLAKHPGQRGWLFYAMSIVAPTKAIPIVADELSKATNIHHCATLAFTLQQCGSKGIAALDQIEKRAEHPHHASVRGTLALRRRSEPDPWPDLPAAPDGTFLPVRLAEIDERVRIQESLPGSVTVDRSTPRKTLESWFMALRIADRDAYSALTGDNRKLKGIFDDLCDPSDMYDTMLLTYDLTEVTNVNRGQALALITLHLVKTDHQLTIELSRANEGWRVERVEESRR